MLRKGLDLHGKRIAPALKAMQQNLEGRLEMMVSEVFPERRNKAKKVRFSLRVLSLSHDLSSPLAVSFLHGQECSSAPHANGRVVHVSHFFLCLFHALCSLLFAGRARQSPAKGGGSQGR